MSASFVHVILLKVTAGDRAVVTEAILRDAQELLPPVASVRGLWVGRPASGAQVGSVVIDADYDVGLVLLFDSAKGFEEYRADPAHLEFQRRFESLVKVRAIDFSPYGSVAAPQP
jgi:hypothetical protein